MAAYVGVQDRLSVCWSLWVFGAPLQCKKKWMTRKNIWRVNECIGISAPPVRTGSLNPGSVCPHGKDGLACISVKPLSPRIFHTEFGTPKYSLISFLKKKNLKKLPSVLPLQYSNSKCNSKFRRDRIMKMTNTDTQESWRKWLEKYKFWRNIWTQRNGLWKLKKKESRERWRQKINHSFRNKNKLF